jgi:hypothetical protein
MSNKRKFARVFTHLLALALIAPIALVSFGGSFTSAVADPDPIEAQTDTTQTYVTWGFTQAPGGTDLSLSWDVPEATLGKLTFTLVNPLGGLTPVGASKSQTTDKLKSQFVFAQSFAGSYTAKLNADLTLTDGTETTVDATLTKNDYLKEYSSWQKVDFPDVRLSAVTVTYVGAKKPSKVPAVNTERLDSIKWLSGFGITVGSGSLTNGQTTYRAQDPVTRGAMAQFLQKLGGFTDAQIAAIYSTQPNKFTDLGTLKTDNPARYYSILWLSGTGITVGCNAGGTKFCPTNPVNRGAMAEFLQRFAGVANEPSATSAFPDVNKAVVTLKYKGYNQTTRLNGLVESRVGAINWIKNANITIGSGSTAAWGKFASGITTYRPQDSVNRGSMAQFMHKLAYKLESTLIAPK